MEVLGRPTKYRREFNRIAKHLCKLGATDETLAESFDVSVQTLNTWKHEHPTFLASIKSSKLDADAEVERSLFERAKGYSHEDIDIRAVSLGNNQGSEIVQTPIIKHYPPDPVSCIFWLKNRQPDKWRDVQRSEIAMLAKVEVSQCSVEDVKQKLIERGVEVPQ